MHWFMSKGKHSCVLSIPCQSRHFRLIKHLQSYTASANINPHFTAAKCTTSSFTLPETETFSLGAETALLLHRTKYKP